VSFRISAADTPVVKVQFSIGGCKDFLKHGSQEALDQLFPGMLVAPDAGFDICVQFDCSTLTDKETFLNNISQLKRHVIGGPIKKAFEACVAGSADGMSVMKLDYRAGESMFVCPSNNKVVVIFMVDMPDQTDKQVARIYLQQFFEAQREIRSAPPTAYSKERPMELQGLTFNHSPNIAGFLSFALEKRHIEGAKKDKALVLLAGFRNYLHYHIKCSKTYLHMRMRKKVAGWLQVLNRAVPEVETEKKTAAGKTFVKK
jgi:actin related protein 2/3 complex subunit 2